MASNNPDSIHQLAYKGDSEVLKIRVISDNEYGLINKVNRVMTCIIFTDFSDF